MGSKQRSSPALGVLDFTRGRTGAFLFGKWCEDGWTPCALWEMSVLFPPSGSSGTLPVQPGPMFVWCPAAMQFVLSTSGGVVGGASLACPLRAFSIPQTKEEAAQRHSPLPWSSERPLFCPSVPHQMRSRRGFQSALLLASSAALGPPGLPLCREGEKSKVQKASTAMVGYSHSLRRKWKECPG